MSGFRALLVVASSILAGCQPMPSYSWTDGDTALSEMTRRAERVRSVDGPCGLRLTDQRGETIRFEAALTARLPDHLRLRAWKLGRVAFDVLQTPDDLWVQTPHENLSAAVLQVDRFFAAWTVAVTGRPEDVVSLEDEGGREFTIVGREEHEGEQWTVRCVVVRSTLLPRLYTLEDDAGAVLYALQLDRYRSFDGIAWPTRMTGRAAGRTFVLEMNDPVFNKNPAPAAFEPPPGAIRRSVWQPTPHTSRLPRSSRPGDRS